MEPKDLKNSDELKPAKSGETENKENLSQEKPAEKEIKSDTSDVEEKKDGVIKEENTGEKDEEKTENPKENETQENKEAKAESSDGDEEKEQIERTESKDSEKKEEENSDPEPEKKAESKPRKETEKIEEKSAEQEQEQEKKEQPAESKLPSETKTETSEEKQPEQKETRKKEDEQNSAGTEKKKEKPAAAPKKEPVKTEKSDYNTYNQVELVNALRDLLEGDNDFDIKYEVEAIKAAFYKQSKEEVEEEKKKFLEDGGEEEDFQPKDNPYEKDIKELLKKYRHLRIEFNKKLDKEKEKNLELKYQIIEEIKGLINKEESINKTFNEFRELQQKWRETGLVPQSKMKDLWENYHFHVENFYDYIKINKELRDLDLKKNMEMKIKLCEQAEELLLEPNIIKAFNALQKLHDRYREIGPVPREHKDDLWERFKAATTKINKKHQEYFEDRKADQKKNLIAKRELCEKVEQINQLEIKTHKDWNEKSKEVINIQKIWRTIGFAPRKDNNKIYDRFRKACDTFFDAKRDFYSKNKELQQNNLQAKIDLCVQAEALKDSTDWKKTTKDFIDIQQKWKEIGPVPRKQSDAIWKRFRTACDYFFDQKSEHFSNIDSEQVENLKKKEELIKEIEEFKSKGDVDENLKVLKDFQRRWTEIGHVPIKKKNEIQKKFRDAINRLYDNLNLDEQKRNMLKFRTKISSLSESSRGQNKMRFERDKYMNKLKQLENDLVLLDNNIGFFAESKNAESLIKDVNKKIEDTKKKIEFLKNKIRVIDEMDQSEE